MHVLKYQDYIVSEYHSTHLSAAIGNFDGFHQGHQMIINKAVRHGKENKLLSAVITFEKHPQLLLNNNFNLRSILSPEEKISKLKELGIDLCIFLPDKIEFLQIQPEDFIRDYIIRNLSIKKLFVGKNFHFGKKAAGNTDFLIKTLNESKISVDVSTLLTMNNETISSSRIRKLINEHQFSKANELLNYKLFHKATVVKGDQIGRTIDIPTANLDYNIPGLQEGVYEAKIWFDKIEYKGLLFFGSRDTLNKPAKKMEIHILDYTGPEIYGESLYFKTCNFVRKNIKFNDINNLRKQIMLDIEKIKS